MNLIKMIQINRTSTAKFVTFAFPLLLADCFLFASAVKPSRAKLSLELFLLKLYAANDCLLEVQHPKLDSTMCSQTVHSFPQALETCISGYEYAKYSCLHSKHASYTPL